MYGKTKAENNNRINNSNNKFSNYNTLLRTMIVGVKPIYVARTYNLYAYTNTQSMFVIHIRISWFTCTNLIAAVTMRRNVSIYYRNPIQKPCYFGCTCFIYRPY